MSGRAGSVPDHGHGAKAVRPGMKRPSLESTGFFLLLSLLFVTPLAEALKNLLIAGLFIWWLAAGNIGRDLRTAPLYVKSFLLFSTLPLVTLFTSELTDAKELIFDVKGAVKFGIALLPVYSLCMRKNGQEESITCLMIMLIAGGIAACVHSFISWEQTEDLHTEWMKYSYMELRGVGHVNQSALYLILLAISAIMLIWSKKTGLEVFGWFSLIFFTIFLIPTRSITAYILLIFIIMFWIGFLIILNEYGTILKIFVSCTISVFLCMMVIPNADQTWNKLMSEFRHRYESQESDVSRCATTMSSCRFHILRTAFEVYDRHPWFGAGPDQFGKATSEEEVRDELERESRNYNHEKQDFHHSTHGHNIWATVLVERGVSGVVLVALFFALSGFRLCQLTIRILSRKNDDSCMTQLMFLSGATWIMLFVGGLANTTLHLEHGLVGVMLLVWSLTSLELRTASFQGLK